MIIKHIACKNFRQYKKLDFEFPRKGLIAIVGENEAGKSTVQEMVSYALFGSDVLRTVIEKVLSFDASDKEFNVVLTFLMGEDEYTILRGTKFPNKTSFAVMHKNGVEMHRTPKAVDLAIKEIMGGLNWRTFYHTYCIRQKELSLLSSMRASDRKSFVLKMLQIDVIDEVLRKIRSQISDLQAKLDAAGADENVDDLERKLQEIVKEYDAIVTQHTTLNRGLQDKKEELKQIREKHDGYQKKISDFSDKMHALEMEVQKKKATLEEKNKQRTEWANKIVEIKKQSENKVEVEPLTEEYEKLLESRNAHKQAEERKKNLNALKEKQVKASAVLDHTRTTITGLEERVSEIDSQMTKDKYTEFEGRQAKGNGIIAKLNASLDSIKDQIQTNHNCLKMLQRAEGTVACPTCGSEISDEQHFLNEISKLENEQTEKQTKLEEMNGKMAKLLDSMRTAFSLLQERDKCQNNLEHMRDKERDTKASLKETEDGIKDMLSVEEIPVVDEKRIQELKKQVDYQKDIRNKIKEGKELLEKLNVLKQNTSELQQSVDEGEEKIKESTDKLAKFKANSKVDDIKDNIVTIESAIDTLYISFNSVSELKSAKENEKQMLVQAIEKLQQKIKALETVAMDVTRYTKLLNYFTQFKINMITQITPKLSDMLSDLVLNTTNRYSTVMLDDDYNIQVDIDGVLQPIDILSGGATDLFNVCLRFSISKYLNESTGMSMKLIFLDEIFGSLSDDRKKNLLKVMETLKLSYEQIIMITHVSDVTEYVDKVINVVYDSKRGSTLVLN